MKDFEKEVGRWWTKSVNKKNRKNIELLILLKLMLLNPVRNDYAVLSWKDTQNNNVVIKNRILIRDFKTKKKHGMIEILIPKATKLMLKRWKRKVDWYPHLFVNCRNKPLTRNNLTKMFNQFFVKKLQKKLAHQCCDIRI